MKIADVFIDITDLCSSLYDDVIFTHNEPIIDLVKGISDEAMASLDEGPEHFKKYILKNDILQSLKEYGYSAFPGHEKAEQLFNLIEFTIYEVMND